MTSEINNLKFLIADDHQIMRESVKTLAEKTFSNLTVIEASSLQEILTAINENSNISLLILDLKMPGMLGHTTVETLIQQNPDLPILINSAEFQVSSIEEYLEIGVRGYFLKTGSSNGIIIAMQSVLSGEIYLPKEYIFKGDLTKELGASQLSSLTKKELNILEQIAEGYTNKEISHIAGIMESTVKVHVNAIFKKLKINNRVQATKIFLNNE